MLATTKNILKKAGFQPLKRLGQNFLTDKNAVKKIIEAAELKPTDIILEIGPGTGTLTQELARRVKKVIAVEKDRRMVEILKETLKDFNNVKIIYGDILKIENLKLKIKNSFKVVANLPYYIVSPVIRKFLESGGIRYRQTEELEESGGIKYRQTCRPTEMILMVQKEVGQRICAKPPDMNLLAVSVQFYVHPVKSLQSKFNGAGPKIISYISKKSFWPQPKVDAAIIKIQIPKSKPKNVDRDLFFKIVKAGFSQPRKQLVNNLSKKLKINKGKIETWLLKNGIHPTQRAETLTIKNWIKLAKTYKIK